MRRDQSRRIPQEEAVFITRCLLPGEVKMRFKAVSIANSDDHGRYDRALGRVAMDEQKAFDRGS